jgi:hypothetical protein
MAMAEKSLFWRVFDKAEEVVAPRLEEAVRGDTFLDALGLAARARARLSHGVERRSRWVWHLMNLPAGSDVTHLRRQIAELDRELRRVSVALERALAEQHREEEDDGQRAAESRGPARPRPAGRGAQRAPGP